MFEFLFLLSIVLITSSQFLPLPHNENTSKKQKNAAKIHSDKAKKKKIRPHQNKSDRAQNEQMSFRFTL